MAHPSITQPIKGNYNYYVGYNHGAYCTKITVQEVAVTIAPLIFYKCTNTVKVGEKRSVIKALHFYKIFVTLSFIHK